MRGAVDPDEVCPTAPTNDGTSSDAALATVITEEALANAAAFAAALAAFFSAFTLAFASAEALAFASSAAFASAIAFASPLPDDFPFSEEDFPASFPSLPLLPLASFPLLENFFMSELASCPL